MDSWEERNSQPPMPRCTRGCLVGCCFCVEQDEAEAKMAAAEAERDRREDR